jgi:c-di-GMP-binding flagellar brake protein YcgR
MPHVTGTPTDHGDKTRNIPMGSPASLTFSSDSKERETLGIFVGSEAFNYIIVRLPSDYNGPTLTEGLPIWVKYTSSGNFYTCKSSVIHYLEKFELVFISYPHTFERVPMRKEDRVSCWIPATANVQKKALKGLVTDISYHGCQFSVKIPSTIKLQQVSVLTDIDLSLTISGYTDTKQLKGKVRNTNFNEFKIVLGIEFEKLEDQFVKRLSEFIDNLKNLQ